MSVVASFIREGLLAPPGMPLIWFVATGLFLVAIWRGGWPERVTTLANLLALLAHAVTHILHPHGETVHWGCFAIEVARLAATLAVVAFTNRTWVLWLAAFSLLSVASYLAHALIPALGSRSGFATQAIWYGAGLVAMTWGVLAAAFRKESELTQLARARNDPKSLGPAAVIQS